MEKFWLDEKYQREIKFRAWSIEDNKMYSWEEMKSILFKWWFEEMVFEYNSYIPMMFTGLKDINNKEAYELDIIIHPNSSTKYLIRFGKYDDGDHDYPDIGYGWFQTKIDNLDCWDEMYKEDVERIEEILPDNTAWGKNFPKTDRFEIIGNVFENPELIEQC